MSDYTDNSSIDLGDPDKFVQGMNGSVEATQQPTIPEKIGEFETEKYFGAMNALTEGKVKNYNDFQEVLSVKDRYSQLEKQYHELDAKSKISPYASDLVKELNEMQSKGATVEQMEFFLGLQKIDLANIQDANAIKLAKKLTLNGLTDEQVQQWYEDTYGDGETLTGSQQVKILEDAKAARETLAKVKKDAGQPPAVLQQKQAQEQFQKRFNFWDNVMQKTFGQKEKHSIEVSLGKDAQGQESSLKYDFPIPAETRKEIALEVAKNAAKNGYGNNEDGYKAAQNLAEVMLWAKHGKDIVANAVRHAKSNVTQAVLQEQHNVRNLGQDGKGDPIVNQAEQDAIRSFAKENAKR